MYVCLCSGITDREIKRSIRDGAESLQDLQNQLGVATQCGQCAHLAEEILDQMLHADAEDNLAYAAA